MPNLKTLPAHTKAADDDGTGLVEALVATYDVDSGGDRILPGAFTKSLDEWGASGNRIPFIWAHMHNDLDAYLGEVLEAKETDEGLWVKAQIDMDDPKAAKAYRMIKGGRVHNYSFAYEVIDGGPDEDGAGDTVLRELKVYEVGPCLIGMNEQTRTLVAKADETDEAEEADISHSSRPTGGKAGRVLSAKNESDLREAADLIRGVLAQLDRDQGKTSDTGPATDKEPERATAKEPSRVTPVHRLAAQLNLLTQKGRSDESA